MPNILIRDVPDSIADAIAAKAGPRGREGYIRDLMVREADRLAYEDGTLLVCLSDIGSDVANELVGEGMLQPFWKGCVGRRMSDSQWQNVPKTLTRIGNSISRRDFSAYGIGMPTSNEIDALEIRAINLIDLNPKSRCPDFLRAEGSETGMVPLDIPRGEFQNMQAAAKILRAYVSAVGKALDVIEQENAAVLRQSEIVAASRERAKASAHRLLILARMIGSTGSLTQSKPNLCIRASQVREGQHYSQRSLVLVDSDGREHGIQVYKNSVLGDCMVVDEADELPPGDLIQVRLPVETDAGHWRLTFPMTSASIRRAPLFSKIVDVAAYPLLEELRLDEQDIQASLYRSKSQELLLFTLSAVSTRGIPEGEGYFIEAVAQAVLDGLDREEVMTGKS